MAELPTARQQRAIEALLSAPSRTAAAKQSGVSERTLRRWLATPAFRGHYEAAGRARMYDAMTLLRAAVTDAVATLRDALSAPQPADRIRAAALLLEHGVNVEVDELAARVAALETARDEDVDAAIEQRLAELEAEARGTHVIPATQD